MSHVDVRLLRPTARQGDSYRRWRDGYELGLDRSREDFVAHHHAKVRRSAPGMGRGGSVDWGGLARLYGFAPATCRIPSQRDAVSADLD